MKRNRLFAPLAALLLVAAAPVTSPFPAPGFVKQIAAAAALLAPAGTRVGQAPAGPKYSSVTVKFWLKDGAVSKYSTHSVLYNLAM